MTRTNQFANKSVFTLLGLIGMGLCVPTHSAHTQTIADLFNTGVDSSGSPILSNGVSDPHYTNGSSAATYTIASLSGYNSYADADYITIDPNGGVGSYTDTFNTTFTLSGNVDLSSVDIAGNYSIDNTGVDILINGHSTGITLPGGTSSNFDIPHGFRLPTGFYRSGTNTLGFTWTNVTGPGAIAISFTSKFDPSGQTVTPEPGPFALFVGMAVCGAGLLRRRYGQKASAT